AEALLARVPRPATTALVRTAVSIWVAWLLARPVIFGLTAYPVLQWHCPRQRWVLKAPLHLPGLRALFATYPDANVIMLHRDPLEVVASVASLHVTLRRTFSDAVETRWPLVPR